MPNETLRIRKGTALHNRIISAVRDRVLASKARFEPQYQQWRKAEEAARAYVPERDIDALRRAERETGRPQYTTISIPYSYGVLMASHTYWTTVFLARSPVFQFIARHGEAEQQVMAMEAVIDYQMQVGEMAVPLYLWLLDAGKYGTGWIGVYWDKEERTISTIVEERPQVLGQDIPSARPRRRMKTDRVVGYQGNRIINIRPFDIYPDPRVPTHLFQKGEFIAYYMELGWNTILRRAAQGYYTNVEELSRLRQAAEREQGSSQLDLPGVDGYTFTPEKVPTNTIRLYECHIELTQKEWGLGNLSVPEKWVFTVTADWSLVIGAAPLGAVHDKFPFQYLEMEPEGYGLGARGIPEILRPIQDTMDWLINSHFYNVRKTLNNQFIVDPSRVVMKDFNNLGAGGGIRLSPAAYGTDVNSVLKQLTVVDITQNHLRDLSVMLEIGQRAIGVNDQIMGVFHAGGRKTATEVRTSSSFGINRLKTISEYFSALGWTPLAQMLVQNTQQYLSEDRKYRIVGDLAQEAGPQFVTVSPETIQGFFDFVPVDGTLPVDRFAQANVWRELLGQMRNFPQIMQQYDIGRIFAWVAQLAGLKNINQFRVQVLPDEELARQAEQGNIVPLGGPGGPA